MVETFEMFLARKAEESRAQYEQEFTEQERQRKIAEARSAQDAVENAEMNARFERLVLTQSRQYVSPEGRYETCTCGESVPIGSASHTTKDGALHVRNPRLAVQYGRISREVFNELNDLEKANGFMVGGAGLTTGVIAAKEDIGHLAGRANVLAGLTVDPALRQR
jgi:hypothetical protein